MGRCIMVELQYDVLENGENKGLKTFYDVCVDRLIAAEYFEYEYSKIINENNRYDIIILLKSMFENEFLDSVFTDKNSEHYEDAINWLKKKFLEHFNEEYKDICDDPECGHIYQLTL